MIRTVIFKEDMMISTVIFKRKYRRYAVIFKRNVVNYMMSGSKGQNPIVLAQRGLRPWDPQNTSK